jgi:enoyl-CoA hydratase/carnithine racemase
MGAHQIRLEREGCLAVLTLDRPSKRNALDAVLWAQLGERGRALAADPPRVVILRGEGAHFSAGMDLSMSNPLLQRIVPAMMEKDAVAARAVIEDLKGWVGSLTEIPCPVIASIEGACAGGGLEVALTADLRVAAEGSFFSLPELQVGLAPDVGGSTRLSALIGRARATEMILTGCRIDAQTALSWGLVNRVCPAGEAFATSRALATQVLRSAPSATRAVLPMLRAIEGMSQADAAEAETLAGIDAIFGGEVMEGAMSFMERRAPSWADEV